MRMERMIISLFSALLIASISCVFRAGHVDSIQAVCSECHTDINDMLPEKHARVTGNNIEICFACHIPGGLNKAKFQPFCTRLHRAHNQPGNEAACTVCHNWVEGSGLTLPGTNHSYGSGTEAELVRNQKIFSSWAASPFLDALHASKYITCCGCHGSGAKFTARPTNWDRCKGCHPGYDSSADELSSQTPPKVDPHQSHVDNLTCGVCHKAHAASSVYCLECHDDLNLSIPGGRANDGT